LDSWKLITTKKPIEPYRVYTAMLLWGAILLSMKLVLRAKVAVPAVAAELGDVPAEVLAAVVAVVEVPVAADVPAVVVAEAADAVAAVAEAEGIAIVVIEAAAVVVAGNLQYTNTDS
jgi:hypothetical protein